MAIINGSRGTGGNLGVSSDQRVIDMADAIYRLEPDNNPLVLLATQMSREVATQPKYNHLEDSRLPRYSQVNNGAGYTSADTTFTVDDGTPYRANHVILNTRTGETMLVSSAAATSVVVTRSLGATAAAALVDNDVLLIVADAQAENSSAPTPKSTTPSTVSNYTGIYRTPFAVSGTAQNVKYYGEDELTRLDINSGLEHGELIERGFFFGEKSEDLTGDQPRRTTGGLNEFVTTNRTTQAQLTKAEFLTFLRTDAFMYGSSTKWLYCSGIIAEAMASWGIADLQLRTDDTVYGINVMKWLSPFGTLIIKPHMGFTRWGYDGTLVGGMGFVVDPAHLGYKHIANRDTQLKRDILKTGIDGRTDEYMTECGLFIRNENTFAVLDGVTSFT